MYICGVGVVVERDGRLLLGLRKGRGEARSWSLPGGRLEPGEDFPVCAARELREETGLIASEMPQVVTVAIAPTGEGGWTLTVGTVVRTFSGEPSVTEPDRFCEWKWFLPTEVPTPCFGPTEQILRALLLKLADNESERLLPAYPLMSFGLGRES